MRKLLLSLFLMTGTIASLGQESSETPVFNETTQVGYDDLKSAWDAAADGAILIINQDQTISSRLDANSRTITLKGVNPDIRILRASSFLNGSLIIPRKAEGSNTGGTINYENLVFDGENQQVKGSVLEAANNGVVTLKNVRFVNCVNTVTSGNQGLVTVKGGGNLTVENTTFENCSLGEQYKGEIFIGAWCPFKVIGNCVFSVFLDSTSSNIRVQNVTNTEDTPIVVFINTNVIEPGYNLFRTDTGVAFSGCFVMGTPGYKIDQDEKGNHVVAVDETSSIVKIANTDIHKTTKVYNLRGMEVNEGASFGIYIINGKKVYRHR